MTVVFLAHHAATRAAGLTESDWIRWIGVLITAVGTLVAAPSGVARLLRAVTGTLAVIWWLLTLIFSKKARRDWPRVGGCVQSAGRLDTQGPGREGTRFSAPGDPGQDSDSVGGR